MHLHPWRLTLLPLLVAAAAACAPAPASPPTAAPVCSIGSRCIVEGRLAVFRGAPASVAELSTPHGCYAVALAEADYRRFQRRGGVRVRVLGTAYRQAYAADVVSWTLNGRLVATGVCPRGPILYADAIERIH